MHPCRAEASRLLLPIKLCGLCAWQCPRRKQALQRKTTTTTHHHTTKTKNKQPKNPTNRAGEPPREGIYQSEIAPPPPHPQLMQIHAFCLSVRGFHPQSAHRAASVRRVSPACPAAATT